MSHGRSRRRKPRFGQNFLVNPGVSAAIVAALGDVRDRAVIEVGPGKGALTWPLLEAARRVVAIEVDRDLAAALELDAARKMGSDPVFRGELVVLREDATRLDWALVLARALEGGGAAPVPFASNLPYESGTAILLDWLAASARDERLGHAVVMLQLEVAERLAARPGDDAYGSLAALAACTHVTRPVMKVSPGSFRPQPKVWSQVVRLDRRPDPLFAPDERDRAAAFIAAAFAHRRKQLASALAGHHGATREDWQARLAALGRPPTARAEELTPMDLVALSRDTMRT